MPRPWTDEQRRVFNEAGKDIAIAVIARQLAITTEDLCRADDAVDLLREVLSAATAAIAEGWVNVDAERLRLAVNACHTSDLGEPTPL